MAPSFIHGTLKKLDLGLTRLSTRNAKAIQHGEPLLPTIACELVIDFVARERPTEKVWENDALRTLRACSLTCRAWRLRSQYHLFRFLVVKCTQKHMKGVIALLDRHPALCSRIELLVIKPRAVGDPLTDNIPPRITQRLGSVPEIRLSSCYIAPGSRIDSYLQQFTAITTLNLFYVEFKTFEDMRRITMLFHNLTSLTINATKWRGYPDAQPSSIVLPVKLRLRELYIAGSAKWMQDHRANALFEWLAQSGILSGLEILKLQNLMILTDASCASVRGVVEAALSTLTMVSFSPGPELDYTICETLVHCANLKLLTLVIPYHSSSFGRLTTFLQHDFLETTPYLSIRFTEYPKCALPAIAEWSRLDDVLQSPKWAPLLGLFVALVPKVAATSFKWGDIYLDKSFDADARRQMFREYLPKTYERGVVQYWRGDDAGYVLL